MKRLLINGSAFLMLLALITGCAWFESKEESTAQELASDGMEQFKNGDYKDAIKTFQNLKDWYPFSKFAILAELKIADAHYKLEEYEEAIFAYEEFENLHPRNEAIPYVLYQIGRCHFDRLDTVDRDQTSARKALEAFDRLQKQFPENSYAIRSGEHMKKCLKSLAGHEFYVGVFYYKSKHYKAALSRFRSVLLNYPDVGVHHKALEYIALCEAVLEEEE
jgi:outer membrane protein assembly factor BamD